MATPTVQAHVAHLLRRTSFGPFPGQVESLSKLGLDWAIKLVTTSEFGRRVPDNESNGLDHGAGSFAFLLGPVNAGLYDSYPDLSNLDDDGNLVSTTHINDYYATLAEGWFGVPSSDVISGGTALTGIFS